MNISFSARFQTTESETDRPTDRRGGQPRIGNDGRGRRAGRQVTNVEVFLEDGDTSTNSTGGWDPLASSPDRSRSPSPSGISKYI